jgi:hypothetical protein
VRSRGAIPLLLTALCLPGLRAAATSYVPMTDEALVAQAPVAVVVEIGGAGSPAQDGRYATEYTARVERVLKGDLAAREITVRVPGGMGADGIGLQIWGAPRFTPGERALLFLVPEADGAYQISQLMLGAFHEARAGSRRYAVRDLSEAQPVVPHGWKVPAEERLRDFDRFAAWVEARAHGRLVLTDYTVRTDPRLLRNLTDRFTFQAATGDGLPARWFLFDSAGSVSFLAHQNGQSGLTGGGFTEFQTALAAWNADAGTNINYTYGGTTTNTNGLTTYDMVNTIIFDQNLGSPYSCTTGGVLARGGAWYSLSVTTYHGQSYHTYLNADVVTNTGTTCFYQLTANPSKAAQEIFAHELGHTLGLGHACGDTPSGSCTGRPDQDAALMRATVHNDGRGAQLGVDDRTGIAVLYTPATPAAATNFFTVSPCRLLDTRNSGGGGPLSTAQTRTLSVLGLCGIPSTAVSIVGNVTAVSPTGGGTLTLAPASAGVTGTSSVSFNAGNTRASQALIGLSGTGSRAFTIRAGLATGSVDVIVDVTGYFQ